MKKTLLLHIGMGKTGTTALQDFFWSNRGELRRFGIAYPEFGTMAHAHHLLSPYAPPGLRDRWKFATVAEWSPRLLAEDADTILVSSELIAWAPSADTERFCDDAGRLFDLKVVIYLRRQDDMIMANYNQLVKAGSQRVELEWALEKQLGEFDYTRILEPWARSLGKYNIIVRPYEKRQFYRGDIRRDFMHHVFGLDIDRAFELPEGDPNPRFSQAAMEYKLQLNRLIENSARSSRFNEVLRSYSGQSDASAAGAQSSDSLLSPARRLQILERSLPANQAIARDYLHRDDGILFEEAPPDETGHWVKPQLDGKEARLITRFIKANNRRTYKLLLGAVRRESHSPLPMRSGAAKFFRQCLPLVDIPSVRKRGAGFGSSPAPGESSGPADGSLLISVHFPLVTVSDYEALLKEHFGNQLLRDYEDRPVSLSGPARILDALRKGVRNAGSFASLDRNTCVHGHFLPLKYMLAGRGRPGLFVAWMSDPVDRLVAHYGHLKASANTGSRGKLQRLMMREDWSLETFCFRPEIRNLYSKFLWGFPLSRFDFIGIAELHEAELRRFCADILGIAPRERWLESAAPARTAVIDADLRSRIERHHSADMALYRRALQIRQEKLGREPTTL